MSYTLAKHLEQLQRQLSESAPVEPPMHWYMLVDVAQVKGLDRRWKAMAGGSPYVLLFEDTMAHNALALSPVLVALGTNAQKALEQCRAWDKACQSRPALSLLIGHCGLDTISQHLKGLLMIKAEGTDYLWRFADTQMLWATVGVLTNAQRQRVIGPCLSWCVADHSAQIMQVVSHDLGDVAALNALVLDDIQTDAMLEACAGPMLAAQLRALSPSFEANLTHADQSAFAQECVQLAADESINPDSELVSWSIERWQMAQVSTGQTA